MVIVARQDLPADPGPVLVTTGEVFPDALGAGAAAATLAGSLQLTRPDDLPAATRRLIADASPTELIVIGGEAAVSPRVVEQLANTPVEPYSERAK